MKYVIIFHLKDLALDAIFLEEIQLLIQRLEPLTIGSNTDDKKSVWL